MKEKFTFEFERFGKQKFPSLIIQDSNVCTRDIFKDIFEFWGSELVQGSNLKMFIVSWQFQHFISDIEVISNFKHYNWTLIVIGKSDNK